MDTVPQTCTTSLSLSRLAVIINAGHWPEFGLVDAQVSGIDVTVKKGAGRTFECALVGHAKFGFVLALLKMR